MAPGLSHLDRAVSLSGSRGGQMGTSSVAAATLLAPLAQAQQSFGTILMKEATSRNLTQVTLVLRFTTGLLALLSALVLTTPWLQTMHGEAFLAYQFMGALLSIVAFSLTFEQHFPEYWPIEAALFFGCSLLIWSGVGFVVDNPMPLRVLVVVVPIVTVLLPWDWQLQLGICGLCVGAALLATKIRADGSSYQSLWMIVAAESAVAVLASIQLELQRKQSDAYFRALVADEEQFRALIENAPDGLTVVNTVGNIVFQNPSAKRLLGPEDLMGRSVYEFLHQDDVPEFRRLLTECANSPERRPDITLRCRHADGSWRTIEGVAKQLQNYGDEPLVVLNWRDVTERVLQDNRIRASEEKFRKIFQYSTNAISLVSRSDGHYIDVNEEWLRLFGHTRSEVIGKDPLELGRWADSDDYLRYAAELLAKGEIHNRAAVLRTKDGLMVHGLISSVILETNGTSIVLSLISIPPDDVPA
jgi:PAS domain S-box-containing protein